MCVLFEGVDVLGPSNTQTLHGTASPDCRSIGVVGGQWGGIYGSPCVASNGYPLEILVVGVGGGRRSHTQMVGCSW